MEHSMNARSGGTRIWAPARLRKGLGWRTATVAATVAALSMTGVASASAATPEELVPDAAFRSCLDATITSSGLSGGVTEANLAALVNVYCPNMGITSAEGAQWLINAESITLDSNDITTVPSLAPLTNLIGLGFSDNALTNLDFLNGATLKGDGLGLSLANNAITDVSGLNGLNLPTFLPGSFVAIQMQNNGLADDDVAQLATFASAIEAAGFDGTANRYLFLLEKNHFRDLSAFSTLTLAAGFTFGNAIDVACQTVDLGQVAAGASVPLKLRDVWGDAPSPFAQENTGMCDVPPPTNADFFGALPAGITWNGDTLVADPSLIGQTITITFASTGEAMMQENPGEFTVTFTVVAPPVVPPAAPGDSPAQVPAAPGKQLAATGVPSGLIGFGTAAAALAMVLGMGLFVARRRNA